MSTLLASARLATDPDFINRLRAVLARETQRPDADQVAWDIAMRVAVAPGFADRFLWGDQAAGIPPGQAAITDDALWSAVAAVLPTVPALEEMP